MNRRKRKKQSDLRQRCEDQLRVAYGVAYADDAIADSDAVADLVDEFVAAELNGVDHYGGSYFDILRQLDHERRVYGKAEREERDVWTAILWNQPGDRAEGVGRK